MAFRRQVSLTLDSPTFTNVPASGSQVSFEIGAGEYPTPLWLQVENGPVFRIDSLPWRTVLQVPA